MELHPDNMYLNARLEGLTLIGADGTEIDLVKRYNIVKVGALSHPITHMEYIDETGKMASFAAQITYWVNVESKDGLYSLAIYHFEIINSDLAKTGIMLGV